MSGHLKRPLPAGAAVAYWQYGETMEERYDVAAATMHGEMDPFFFMTSHKNFIPHEYPCRTEFAGAFRNGRPEVRGEFEPAHTWLPFGSPRLDLSGFWFRPTRLATWARTCIDAETAGDAVLRLRTPGGGVLWINGAEAGWMAPYGRNLESAAEFPVRLKKGINEVLVFFDDLAERDARYYFQLDYQSGPSAAVALPVDTEPARADAIERSLEMMRLDNLFYRESDVTLIMPEPLDFAAEFDIDVTGDFISFDRVRLRRRLEAGQSRLLLESSETLSAGYRHFHVTMKAGRFAATKSLGAEICHVASQAVVPESLDDRIREALDHFASCPEKDAVRVFAMLAIGRGGREADAIFEQILPSIEDCHDCSDFSLVPLLWARIAYGAGIGETVRQRFDRAVLGYRYWMDEPGNDVQWYFSENHALLFHTSAYLAGNFFADAAFVRSGRTGAQLREAGAARLRAWFDHFEQWEMAEFNSAPYFPVDLKGLTALAALSPDRDIAERARNGIVRLCEIIARSAHQGVLTAAQGRSYEHTLCACRTLELTGLSRLLWGRGWYGGQASTLPQLAVCIRDHGLRIPEEFAALARYQDEPHLEWMFAQGANRVARLYHYKSRDFALGSTVHYRWNQWGYQETILHARLGERPESSVWINHPGEVIQFGYGRPSYWGGCGSLPRNHQYRGLAVVEFTVSPEQPDFTHAWFPADEFDEYGIDNNLAFARSGGGGVMLRGSTAFERTTSGAFANSELRQRGRTTQWLVRVCTASTLADVKRFAAMPMLRSGADEIIVDDPEYGPVVFGPDGTVRAEGRTISPEDYSVRGATLIME